MWRAFPHVLMIDTTYKTNEYRLPFVQIVGVTSTHKSFCVAHAFISKEKQDNFLWVLQNLKGLLEEGMEPRVIVTDCDKALMNACDKVFPKASKLLCRWHISQNILKHTKAKFATAEEWKIFKVSWSRLCNSPTETLYNYNFERLFTRLTDDHRSGVLDYLYTVWLLPYKEKFVSAWNCKIPLAVVDKFWTKLDFNAEELKEDDNNLRGGNGQSHATTEGATTDSVKKYVVEDKGGSESEYD
ncbi:protein FAR1-RELATED SEQUENCE 5-like [Helianthus annuus]|uniref:protein FAR1-RELATED SEQUENCE 5-like n=1 Tax=Helianthus annuus TaxID=4232 RepID=UPI001652E896|nr:protein FAR1-RELATED SEQUENCE 5-like [Helianthus annuus]